MSDNEKRTRPKYESPTVVALGEMAKASGACSVGSAVPIDCVPGVTATQDCTQGDSATRDCTAGLTASGTTCSAGGLK
jgi:hypothetical protein